MNLADEQNRSKRLVEQKLVEVAKLKDESGHKSGTVAELRS